MKQTFAVSRGIPRARMLLPLVAVLALSLFPLAVQAGGVVTTCTETALRAALAGGGTVTVACDGTITLARTLVIATNTVLDATGHAVTLSGGGVRRVLEVASGVQAWLNNITVARGGGTNLGAGLFNGGELWLNNCTFISNKVVTGPCYGGAIYHRSGQLNITGCSFIKNVAAGGTSTGLGGAIGATYTSQAGAMNITNSTFTQNGATTGGGAIGTLAAVAPKTNGPIVLVNCTFAGNTNGAVRAGGGEVFLKNTLARSTTGGNFTGTFRDLGHNISADASKALNSGTSRTNTDPQFGVLGHYGGPTPTVALATNSPAINAGDCAGSPPFDQRGYPRPYAGGCDAGAFEATDYVLVTECSESALRAAMASGRTVLFACDGTIFLTNTLVITNNTTIDGTGRSIVLDGRSAVRLIEIKAGASLVLSNLTLTHGRSTNDNFAPNLSGGAILNAGTLRAVRCSFSDNLSQGGPNSYDPTVGGAMRNNGAAQFHECSFRGNRAVGGSVEGVAREGKGGAIGNFGELKVIQCTFETNTAAGLPGNLGGIPAYNAIGYASGGDAFGGAIFNAGSAILDGSVFHRNSALGGTGGYYQDMHLGLHGGNGGDGFGGAIFNSGAALSLTNCTLAGNLAVAGVLHDLGNFNNGTNGVSLGGGLAQFSNVVTAAFCTLASNSATNGGALFAASGSTLRLGSSIVAASLAGGNASGPIEDLGFNLSSDASLTLTGTGSMNSTDPMLGPLADNGGPTPTMALLPGSPALDAGSDSATLAVDQRGYPRAVGARRDSGAYEAMLPIRFLPALLMSFQQSPALTGQIVTLTFTVINSNTLPLTGIAFTNELSAALRVASVPRIVNSCGGFIEALAGSGAITVSGLALAANQSCSISVDVVGVAPGAITNTAGPVSSSETALGFAVSSAVLQVRLPAAFRFPDCYLAPTNLVAWWPMNGAPTEIRSNNVTTLLGAPEFVPAQVGSGLRFDGEDDYVRVPASAGIDISRGGPSMYSRGFAIELWVNPAHTNSQPILEWNNGLGTYGVSLWIEAGGRLTVRFASSDGSRDYVLASAAGAVVANAFQHIGVSYFPNYGAGSGAALWLNGQVVASAQTGPLSTPSIRADTGYDLYFGYRPSGAQTGHHFTGIMDEVSFYSVGFGWLNDTEYGIPGVYKAREAGKCLTCASAPSIAGLPAALTANNGTTIVLSADVAGTGPLLYQWRFNGTNLPKGTTPICALQSVQTNQSGNYSLVVTGACGTASFTSLVTVLPGPRIIAQSGHRGLLPGQTATFTVQATGPDLIYQWFHDGTSLAGQAASTLVVPNVQAPDAGGYTVVVANAYASVTSAVARLTVGTNALNCDLASLMTAVEIGGYHAFSGGGTIAITNFLMVSNDFVLDGAGHEVVLSGGGSNRIFQVGAGVRCNLKGLTMANGRAEQKGGAIFNDGGELNLTRVVFTNNHAFVAPESGDRDALGGALHNSNGTVTAVRCRWEDNAALGRHALQYWGGSYYVRIPATAGRGGAIHNETGTIWIEDSVFRNNLASGGNGTWGILASGYYSEGGAVNNGGMMAILNTTFDHNGALGGVSQRFDYALYSANGLGGALANRGTLYATNSTLFGNWAQGGTGSPGGSLDGEGQGGGLYAPAGSVVLWNCTLSGNEALPNGVRTAKGASVFASNGVVQIFNSIVANSASGSNCFGVLIDGGHNLSSDSSCNFTNVGSMNNMDPRLGSLADNGGPTMTMALLPFSPAIDAGDETACPATDQRRQPRPALVRCDIGAYEVQPDFYGLTAIQRTGAQTVRLSGLGLPASTFRVQSSGDLIHWTEVANGTADVHGAFEVAAPVGSTNTFFRIMAP